MEYATIGAPRTTSTTEQRALETIVNEIVIARNRAEEHLMALSALADRVFGPMPQGPQGQDKEAPPFCEIDAIQIELRRFRGVQENISSQISRLLPL